MKRAATVVLFNVLATLVLLLALEGASRLIQPVAFPEPLITERNAGWAKNRQYDPLLFWTMRPHTGDRLGRMRTNSLGLRGPEIAPNDSQTFRILSLGESTTWGALVNYEETYSSLLEKELPPVEGQRVEVINAGVPGYTLFQGLTFLRLRGLALKPDAVLLYFGYNDFLRLAYRARRDAGSKSGAEGLTDRELFEQRNTLGYRLTYRLQQYSNLTRILAFRTPAGDEIALDAKQTRVPETDRRWILSELRNLAQHYGFDLVVVIPWYRAFDKHEPLLRELTAWAEITVIDLPAALADLPEPRAGFFLDAVHPNREGHRLIAQAIGEQLRTRWGAVEPAVEE